MTDERYSRLVALGWDMSVLRDQHCLVIGAGALGNEVVKNLALLGIGSIVVVDPDAIEESNLTRSVLFRERDIGRDKAVVLAERGAELDSHVTINPLVGEFQDHLGGGAFYDFNAVFGCLDSVQARLDLNRACLQANCLYLDGGLRGIDGDVKVLGNGYEACYDCLLSQAMRTEAWRRYSCLKLRTHDESRPIGPTAPTIASIIAGLQVQVAVKSFHGLSVPWNHRLSVHGHLDDFSVTRLIRNPTCPTHYHFSQVEPEELVHLPALTTESTLGELYEAIAADLGHGTVIDLDFDLILYGECRKHVYRKEVLKRRGTVFADEVQCPHCLQEGLHPSQAILAEEFTSQIGVVDQLPECSLRVLGFAPRATVSAHRTAGDSLQLRRYLLGDDAIPKN